VDWLSGRASLREQTHPFEGRGAKYRCLINAMADRKVSHELSKGDGRDVG